LRFFDLRGERRQLIITVGEQPPTLWPHYRVWPQRLAIEFFGGCSGVMRGATTPSHRTSACHSPPGRPPEGGWPGHDGPEGLSRLGDLTAPEGVVQRETGLPRCLALDSAEAGSRLRSDSRAGVRARGVAKRWRAGPKPSTTSPPQGAAAKRYRGARLPWRRADRSQRSPRDSSVTGPSVSPTEAGKRPGVPFGPSPKRRSWRRCRTLPPKAGVARRVSFGPRANEVRATVDPGERRSAVLDPTGVGSRALRGERACRPPTRRCTRQVACRSGH
jgi:hypothetical protein